jgi:hypothetical protein
MSNVSEKIVEKIKARILCSKGVLKNLAVCEIM